MGCLRLPLREDPIDSDPVVSCRTENRPALAPVAHAGRGWGCVVGLCVVAVGIGRRG